MEGFFIILAIINKLGIWDTEPPELKKRKTYERERSR